jgi:hypothetical protein
MFCAAGASLAAERARPATHLRSDVHRVIAAVPGALTLYDQNSDDNGLAVLSTDFDSLDSWDSYGADDFIVPAGHKWRIEAVEVSGAYNCEGCDGGPARSESVFFYKDKKGQPGKLVAKCEAIKGADNKGSFAIQFPQSCKVGLNGGKRYWVSVVAAMDFAFGFWGWETRNTQEGKPSMWENPGGGLNDCVSWDVMTKCQGDAGEGPDFMFALKGKDILK